MLAMLGWNDGTGQELFSLDELVAKFSMERVHKGGAKFDFEKAKWFNHQYIQHTDNAALAGMIAPLINEKATVNGNNQGFLENVIALVKDRCTLLPDFWAQGHFFFETPEIKEMAAIKDKWNDARQNFFTNWVNTLATTENWNHTDLEASFNAELSSHGLKKGDVMLPFRIMLVGAKFGPGVFAIAELIGREETIARIQRILA
jgi:glutamyl-tRNA synthetase